jgi:hypothetical protein
MLDPRLVAGVGSGRCRHPKVACGFVKQSPSEKPIPGAWRNEAPEIYPGYIMQDNFHFHSI